MRSLAVLALLVGLCSGTSAAEPTPAGDLELAREYLSRGDTVAARKAFHGPALRGIADAQEALAAMMLEGIGGPADMDGAMQWLCLLAHQPSGGESVTRAAWFLAEYFRTGGGLPGRRYNQGDRGQEDPVKAYFWFRVMAEQDRLYRESVADAVSMGRLGASSVARELREAERQRVEHRLERWRPGQAPGPPGHCLDLPAG